MKVPEQVLPALAKATQANSLPLEFWHTANGNRIMDCFSSLADELHLSGLDLRALPPGYRLAALLFRWETECQSEGWNAFAWTPNIDEIARTYSETGLPEEGAAIARAAAAWRIDHNDNDAISRAYKSGQNDYSVDLDRLEYLVDYLCERADDLFYE